MRSLRIWLVKQKRLDHVFFALSHPVRRRILERIDRKDLRVSELAAPFRISLQAVSRHIQVLVRARLVELRHNGRASLYSLYAAPLIEAATWMNRYSKYWRRPVPLEPRNKRRPPHTRLPR